jgi:hypothetical protein
VDVEAIARNRRRQQVLDALEFERDREEALREQLAEAVTEFEGSRIDEAVYARMSEEEAAIVRETLRPPVLDLEEEDWIRFDRDDLDAEVPDARAEYEAELARLEEEIADAQRRQRAFEHFLEALGE